jgi:murein endopeptidase
MRVYSCTNLIPLNARCLLLLLVAHAVEAEAGTSRCFGTVGNGRIEGSVKLPAHGPNFAAYSAWGTTAGRTYVHSKVADVVVSAYATLASTAPDATFVYGETGLASGGRFRPHRTHQNGYRSIFSSRYATKLESRKRCRQAWETGLDMTSNSIQAQSTENIESTFRLFRSTFTSSIRQPRRTA